MNQHLQRTLEWGRRQHFKLLRRLEPVNMFRHFKGGLYDLIGFAKHTETGEELAVYRDGTGQLYVRPAAMWRDRPACRPHMSRFERVER